MSEHPVPKGAKAIDWVAECERLCGELRKVTKERDALRETLNGIPKGAFAGGFDLPDGEFHITVIATEKRALASNVESR
jgi:hypothetical protein